MSASPPHPPSGPGPAPSPGSQGLFQLRCAVVLTAPVPLPRPPDAAEPLMRARRRAGCSHGDGLVSSPKQPFQSTIIVPILPMKKLRLTEVITQWDGAWC